MHESQNIGGAATGGKTPFGAGGRTPGHATPGHMSIRNVARTPNPYGPRPTGGATPAYGSALPATNYGLPPQTPYGGYQGQPVYAPGPVGVPAGMNPQRAAMIQRAEEGGWGQSSGGGGW